MAIMACIFCVSWPQVDLDLVRMSICNLEIRLYNNCVVEMSGENSLKLYNNLARVTVTIFLKIFKIVLPDSFRSRNSLNN